MEPIEAVQLQSPSLIVGCCFDFWSNSIERWGENTNIRTRSIARALSRRCWHDWAGSFFLLSFQSTKVEKETQRWPIFIHIPQLRAENDSADAAAALMRWMWLTFGKPQMWVWVCVVLLIKWCCWCKFSLLSFSSVYIFRMFDSFQQQQPAPRYQQANEDWMAQE